MSSIGLGGGPSVSYDIVIDYSVKKDADVDIQAGPTATLKDELIAYIQEYIDRSNSEKSPAFEPTIDERKETERQGESDLLVEVLTERIDDVDANLGKLQGLISNPQGFVGKEVLGILGAAGPYGAAIAAAITAIAAGPVVAEQIIKLLARPGGPLNQAFHLAVIQSNNSMFSRQDQRDRLLGRDSVVVFARTGFTRTEGTDVYDTQYERDSTRLSRVGTAYKTGLNS